MESLDGRTRRSSCGVAEIPESDAALRGHASQASSRPTQHAKSKSQHDRDRALVSLLTMQSLKVLILGCDVGRIAGEAVRRRRQRAADQRRPQLRARVAVELPLERWLRARHTPTGRVDYHAAHVQAAVTRRCPGAGQMAGWASRVSAGVAALALAAA